MLKFTIDTNCIIDLAEGRPSAQYIWQLVSAHEQGLISLAIPAITASEKQSDSSYLESFTEFQNRLASLKLSNVELLQPIFYFNLTFWDWCLWSNEEMISLEQKIHQVIFPEREFLYADYYSSRGIDPTQPIDAKWRNAKCDVLALWSHIWHQRDIFVSRDDRAFHAQTKKLALVALGAGRIEYPDTAITLITRSGLPAN